MPEHNRARFRAAWKDLPFVYISALRPLALVSSEDLGGSGLEFVDADGGTKTLVFSRSPLSLERLDDYELIPFTTMTVGRYIIDHAATEGVPVELTQQPRPGSQTVKAALLFRNPRGLWQLSYFEEGVGPVGHEETNKDPSSLVGGAWLLGYRDFTPGVVDAIMDTVP